MLLTIKELGCTGFNFPVLWDCTRARLSLGARLPKGQAEPNGHGSHLSFVVIYSHLVGLIENRWSDN